MLPTAPWRSTSIQRSLKTREMIKRTENSGDATQGMETPPYNLLNGCVVLIPPLHPPQGSRGI